ncbi:homeobox protein Hox-A10-like [Schistocerca piceifrons]|uniref:homeobox protein Hox-A10-like n=1 Tax=Schistocerca piceifrons TaxID=274613 RepID=UPI001F5ECA2B|nr:homeobox protein Hox-A10-like [Schistocerca piceifrons]
MKVLGFLVAVSLAAMAAGEAPSNSYGAPFGQPEPQAQFQRQQAQPKLKAQPKAQPKPQPQPQQQPQAFAQSQAQPAFSAPLSLSPLYAAGSPQFGRQFFIPAPEPSRLSELYRLPNEYGPPPATFTTTTEAATTTTEVPTTTEQANFGFAGGRNAALREAEESGVYYVLQPDGRLHRIAYSHGPAPAAAAPTSEKQRAASSELSGLQQPALAPGYLARFQYQEVQPAGAPIYTYGQPELVRVN